MSESGLATVEPITMRVAAWRTRHKARATDVKRYTVVYDGATIADIEGRTSQTLNDELAAAAWELAQGIARAVTVDIVALDDAGVEIARLPLRVMPVAATVVTQTDQTAVIKALLENNRDMMSLFKEMNGAMVAQLKEVSGMVSTLAKSATHRAVTAEKEAQDATALATDAIATAAAATSGRNLSTREKVENFLIRAAEQHMGMRPESDNDGDAATDATVETPAPADNAAE